MNNNERYQLAKQALNWIKENPAHWDQTQWHCGSSHCFGGVVEMLIQGKDPSNEYESLGTLETVVGLLGCDSNILLLSDNTIENLEDFIEVLFNENVGVELLEKLSTYKDRTVRFYIAKHKNLTPELIHRFIDDNSTRIRVAIAERDDLDQDMLIKLSQDSTLPVLQTLGKRNDLPVELSEQLKESSSEISETIAKLFY